MDAVAKVLNITTLPPETLFNDTKNDFLKESFDFKNNPGLVFVTIACGCTSLWLLFIAFYFSRCLGFVLTKVLNYFYIKDGHIYFGSFSFSLLSGKFMFRDVRYVTKDYNCQVVDGLMIFKWWQVYHANQTDYENLSKEKDLCENGKSRLMFQLNGLEVHIYNRSDLYMRMQDILKCERYGDARKSIQSFDISKSDKNEKNKTDQSNFNIWRDLFPIIRFNIRSGKIALGNRLLETTLWMHFNTGTAAYSVPDAPSPLDYFTHTLQCKCDDVRILLSRSHDYKGPTTDPPRFMGQGFVVLQSGQAKFNYYQDEPGIVPAQSDISSESDPEWGLDISFTKNCTITYGPWVDKQRDAIQKFFLPNDFQEMEVSKPLEPGQVRLHTGFDMKVRFDCDVSMDLLYSKDKETSAIHICFKDASFLFHQPWLVNEYGYTSNVVASMKEISVSSSLQFQKKLECDMIEVAANMTIPRMWNQFQHWTCEVWLVKSTLYFIPDHQAFFVDFFNDWSSTEPPDIAKFVPYEWEFNFYLKDYEIILLVNEHNWIDCTNENENNEVALCGESLEISFTLPFTEFYPETVEIKHFFCAETVMLRSFVPEANTIRRSIISLARSSDRDMYPKTSGIGSIQSDNDQVDGPDNFDEVDCGVSLEDQLSKGWRRRTVANQGWVDIWSVPVIILNLYYKYHPVVVSNDITRGINRRLGVIDNDDNVSAPENLAPDTITVELEAGSSTIRIFGHFWRQFFMGFKGNYFGLYEKMSPFNSYRDVQKTQNSDINFNDVSRHSRPLEANVNIVLLDIQAELTNHTSADMVSPQAYIDKITFEMRKTYEETRLQLIVSPISLIIGDTLKRHADDSHLGKGFLLLTGLQFRGHAMFSGKDRPLGTPTLEYAWLMEIQCGLLKGKVTPLQLHSLLTFVKTFILHGVDCENATIKPDSVIKCQHGNNQLKCEKLSNNEIECPTEDDLKYNMIRASVEAVDLYIVEAECACNITASPIRYAMCNARKGFLDEGGTLFVNEISIRQFIQQVNLTLSESQPQHYVPSHSNSWLEVAVVGVGPITADILSYCKDKSCAEKQIAFLQSHDEIKKNLWFIWSESDLKEKLARDRCSNNICGCVGGCNFFGDNTNGVRFFTTQVLTATHEKHSHFGSESLWGRKKSSASGIKNHLLRRSQGLSRGASNSETAFPTKSMGMIKSPSVGGDVIDFRTRSMSMSSRKAFGDSKLAFGRSKSLLNGDVSIHQSLRRFDSDGTFYSCNSETDLTSSKFKEGKFKTPAMSTKTAGSSESFVSAMSSADDVIDDISDIDIEDGEREASFRPLVNPALLSTYSNHMQPVTCINWKQGVPSAMKKKFSLLKNLKVICPPGHRCNLPNIPNFNPSIQGKLPFSIVSPKVERLLDQVEKLNTKNKRFENENVLEVSTVISIKFHQQATVVLTPLLINAVDKYLDSLKHIPEMHQLPSILDSSHLACITRSKQKYNFHRTVGMLLSEYPNQNMHASLDAILPPTKMNVFVNLPCVQLFFFQVLSDTYLGSDQSSLSGHYGSEFSYRFDADDTADSVLFVSYLSNVSMKLHKNTENDALLDAVTALLHKSSVGRLNETAMKRCSSLIRSNIVLGSANADFLQCQLLNIKGPHDKSLNVTEIPTSKSSVKFYVKKGGSLYLDNFSLLPSNEEKEKFLGNVIVEAGIDKLNITFTTDCSIAQEAAKHKAAETCKSDSIAPSHVKSTLSNASFGRKDYNDGATLSHESYNVFSNSSSSIASFYQKPDVRKGYIALDIDSGDVADTSDIDDIVEVERTYSSNRRSTKPVEAVYFRKNISTPNLGVPIIEPWREKKSVKGSIDIGEVWFHLAAPKTLRVIHGEDEMDVNLVTALIPALSCWGPTLVHVFETAKEVEEVMTTWKYSAFACLLGQALPEQGRLVKKHVTSCVASDLSRFLQEEYTSQLIFILRRQTYGHRLNNNKAAVNKKHFIPPSYDLEKGIKALIRQWKCVLIGAEGVDEKFASTLIGSKKPVVGRGVLPKKDLEFLIKDSKSKEEGGSMHHLLASSTLKLPIPSTLPLHEENADVVESESDSSDDDGVRSVKSCTKEDAPEETLYMWMSKSPVSSKQNIESMKVDQPQVTDTPQEDDVQVVLDGVGESASYHLLRSTTPMVSVPTSGVQLADASEVFSPLLKVLGLPFAKNRIDCETSYDTSVVLHKIVIDVFPSEAPDINKATVHGNSAQPTTKEHALELKDLKISFLLKHLSCDSDMVSIMQANRAVIFNVNLRETHLHINFALVRLVLQITETVNVIKEQRKYAKKASQNQRVEPAFQWENLFASLSDPHVEIPKCWKNMYNLMNLYELLPSSKSASSQRISSLGSGEKRSGKADRLFRRSESSLIPSTSFVKEVVKTNLLSDRLLFSLTGTACLKKVVVSGNISGIEIDFVMKSLSSSYFLQHKGESGLTEFSIAHAPDLSMVSLHWEKVKFRLIESVRAFQSKHEDGESFDPPDLKITRTLLTCKVYRSHGLHSKQGAKSTRASSQKTTVHIGPIVIEIPQHPGALRSTVAQFSNRFQKHFHEFDEFYKSRKEQKETSAEAMDIHSMKESLTLFTTSATFRLILNNIVVSAVLLPSLRAEYKIEQVSCWGNFNGKAKFYVDLPHHVLSFNTKVLVVPIPATTHIDLPPIKVQGHYLEIQHEHTSYQPHAQYSSHGYLHIAIDVGGLEQNLTTDLLNHLIFLQKGFIKEVNEVVGDVENNDPVPLWKPNSVEQTQQYPMIYNIQLSVAKINIGATTPSTNGVHLETGEISVELSNRNPSTSILNIPESMEVPKLYGKAQVEVNVSLRQFVRLQGSNEQELNVYANFTTKLTMSNALKDKPERNCGGASKETVMIALNDPHLYVMPTAVDKAVLVYLHYKNAYEYWMEQRLAISTEYPATDELLNRFPSQAQAVAAAQSFTSYLFLQINVNRLALCLPLKEQTKGVVAPPASTSNTFSSTDESSAALLVTVKETAITCCGSSTFVSAGLFRKFCLRFADDFDYTSTYWQVDETDIRNTYSIPEGSYSLCSKTVSLQDGQEMNGSKVDAPLAGKWVMNILWRMCGIDIHMDANIGKRLSLLTDALTAITGETDVADLSSITEHENEDDQFHRENPVDTVDGMQAGFDNSLEKQLLMQTRTVNELRRNNAHPDLISRELKVLQEIEAAISNEFFRDVKRRMRRRKSRRSTMFSSHRRKSMDRARETYLDPIRTTGRKRFRSTSVPNLRKKSSKETSEDCVDGQQQTIIPSVLPEEASPDDVLGNEANEEEKVSPRETKVQFSTSTNDVFEGRKPSNSVRTKVTPSTSTALDFELDVIVEIDSGKCTMHTSDGHDEETFSPLSKKFRKTSEQTDTLMKRSTPIVRVGRGTRSSSGMSPSNHGAPVNEETVLLIPGVVVKVHYLSVNTLSTHPYSKADIGARHPSDASSNPSIKQLTKAARLNAYVSIQSLPKEMILRPSLLDFIEKALEPIIRAVDEHVDGDENSDSVTASESMLSSGSSLDSFPVEVVASIRIAPSDILFSCLPVSKVECLLRIPSLDFAITSTPSQSVERSGVIKKKPPLAKRLSNSRVAQSADQESNPSELGSSLTVCLSRFSFCIFHPYGKQYGLPTDSKPGYASGKRTDFQKAISGRKDSLSLNVEFIKVNVHRRIVKTPPSYCVDNGRGLESERTAVKISALCDIGSAAFNYDMRRLNEILDVPKAWYKRGLMQRIFLGKEGTYAAQTSVNQTKSEKSSQRNSTPTLFDIPESTTTTNTSRKTVHSHRRALSTGAGFLGNLMGSPFPPPRSATVSSRQDAHFQFDTHRKSLERSTTIDHDSFDESDGMTTDEIPGGQWETHVVVAFNVSRIDVSSNIANAMGQAIWSTNDLRTTANVMLNSVGKSTGNIVVAVRQGSFDAHGGVVGGYLELQEIFACGRFDDAVDLLPQHSASVSMRCGEIRVEYMGSSILMATLSSFLANIQDDWKIKTADTTKSIQTLLVPGENKPSAGETCLDCEIMVGVKWEEFQMILSRSTTPDFVKIKAKLEEFFSQQHRSSVRALSSIRSASERRGYYSKSQDSKISIDQTDGPDDQKKTFKYQHWTELINGIKFLRIHNVETSKLLEKNISLTGKINLEGAYVSLACFHGPNFRSQNWALFTFREPNVSFSSKTKVIEKSCQVMRASALHSASFALGFESGSKTEHKWENRGDDSDSIDLMATVRRVSRGRRNPPSLGAPVQEWLIFVNTTSDDGVPSMKLGGKPEGGEKLTHTKYTSGLRKVSFAPKYRYENESELIFALPQLKLRLENEHEQPMTSAVAKVLSIDPSLLSSDAFPKLASVHSVQTNFISHFSESIQVSMDVGLLFYLHDLILSYMREKETSLSAPTSRGSRRRSDEDTKEVAKSEKSEASIKTEEKYREFRVKSWKLEPRIRLLSWAGKRMDPVSIDWVLEKLGFMHAALTIPKWIQRGALDPMDVTLATMMGQLLAYINTKEDD